MFRSRHPALLLVYGRGGHADEMRRVMDHVADCISLKIVSVCESGSCIGTHEALIVEKISIPPPLEKYRSKSMLVVVGTVLVRVIRIFFVTLGLVLRHRIKVVLSTGPGLSLPVAVASRLLGIRVIHLETWCRFSSKSHTGGAMYFLATDFWVQHQELTCLYPKSTYVGML
jgi:beta-1,4-N-acetylglucosaminyltransferase